MTNNKLVFLAFELETKAADWCISEALVDALLIAAKTDNKEMAAKAMLQHACISPNWKGRKADEARRWRDAVRAEVGVCLKL